MAEIDLTIRCAHQCIPDQTIRCPLVWTVQKLKYYLQEVITERPEPEKQKLIYAGQLLKDTQVLQDVLRTYDCDAKLVIHLVYTPIIAQKKLAEEMQLRKRNVPVLSEPPPSVVTSNSSSDRPSIAAAQTAPQSNINMYNNIPSTYSVGAASTNPAIWWQSQQMYNNYLMNYMFYLQQLYGPFVASGGAGPLLPPVVGGMSPILIEQQSGTTQIQSPSQVGIQGGAPVVQQQPDAQPQPQGAAARADGVAPGQAMNAQGGLDEDDEPRDRDWLDWLYVASRIGFLVTILYFYSSIERFLLVILTCAFFYGYQAGWFGRRNNGAVNDERGANDQPGVAQPPADRPQEASGNSQSTPDAESENGLGPDAAAATSNVNLAPEPLPTPWQIFSSTCYTFITSFFISLVPQRPPPLDV